MPALEKSLMGQLFFTPPSTACTVELLHKFMHCFQIPAGVHIGGLIAVACRSWLLSQPLKKYWGTNKFRFYQGLKNYLSKSTKLMRSLDESFNPVLHHVAQWQLRAITTSGFISCVIFRHNMIAGVTVRLSVMWSPGSASWQSGISTIFRSSLRFVLYIQLSWSCSQHNGKIFSSKSVCCHCCEYWNSSTFSEVWGCGKFALEICRKWMYCTGPS